jgi:hypothetical protein
MIYFKRNKVFKSAIMLFGLLNALSLPAQEKIEPDSRKIDIERNTVQKDSLPKINLPDFVITSKEKFELPAAFKINIIENRLLHPQKEIPSFLSGISKPQTLN